MQIWLTELPNMSCVLWKYVTLAKINCYFLTKTVRVGFFFSRPFGDSQKLLSCFS